MNRRSLILGSLGLLAAPAIVRAESLMKIVAPKPELNTSIWLIEWGQQSIEKMVRPPMSDSDLCHRAAFILPGHKTYVETRDLFEMASFSRRIRMDQIVYDETERQIVRADWPYRVTKAPPGGFKIARA